MKQIAVSNKRRRRHGISPVRWTSLSFLAVIIVGSLLLTLPIANKGPVEPYINNLFISVSAVCVTGLSPIVLIDTYSVFGQVVVMLLIQIGGLGFFTFLYFFLYTTRARLSMSTKLVFQEALNQDNMHELPRILKTIISYTAGVEAVGAVFWAIALIPRYGIGKGICYGIWHSVSAFCNAGFDLLGSNSLIGWQNNFLINAVTAAEIVLGGIGFFVVLDLFDRIRAEKRRDLGFSVRRCVRKLSLHTKLVLVTTALLLVLGTIGFLGLEFHNPGTIGRMPLRWKIGTSFFQSVTARTAGFATVDMASLHTATKMLMCVLMFIGGSPGSTAGGIKTVTFALVILMIIGVCHGRDNVIVWGRKVRTNTVLQAFTVFALGLTACVIGVLILSITEPQQQVQNLMLEVFSAFGTVGLSASVTPTLSDVGKSVIMILMYMGRIGPISLMLLFTRISQKHRLNELKYPETDVMVG